MTGRNASEWVAALDRNQWPECVGICNYCMSSSGSRVGKSKRQSWRRYFLNDARPLKFWNGERPTDPFFIRSYRPVHDALTSSTIGKYCYMPPPDIVYCDKPSSMVKLASHFGHLTFVSFEDPAQLREKKAKRIKARSKLTIFTQFFMSGTPFQTKYNHGTPFIQSGDSKQAIL